MGKCSTSIRGNVFPLIDYFLFPLPRRERARVRVSFFPSFLNSFPLSLDSLIRHREHGAFCHAWRSLFGFSSAKKNEIATPNDKYEARNDRLGCALYCSVALSLFPHLLFPKKLPERIAQSIDIMIISSSIIYS